MPLPTNAAALRVLKGQGLDWSGVPKRSEPVYLGAVANIGFGSHLQRGSWNDAPGPDSRRHLPRR